MRKLKDRIRNILLLAACMVVFLVGAAIIAASVG